MKLTSLPYIIGWVLISLSDNTFKLYAGRFISGVAVGKCTVCMSANCVGDRQGLRKTT